jgi:hypothetical protein
MIKSAYSIHRRTLGILGFALPFLVFILGQFGNNGHEWYYSISATYYTNASVLFCIILGASGIFFFFFWIGVRKEYGMLDFIVNVASGIFALLILIFPCSATELERVGLFNLPVKLSGLLHNISACAFFLLLAFNILFLFTKSSGEKTKGKIQRNRVYRACGVGILVFMGVLIATTVFQFVGPVVLICESGMLDCFAASWIVKGEAILPDERPAKG